MTAYFVISTEIATADARMSGKGTFLTREGAEAYAEKMRKFPLCAAAFSYEVLADVEVNARYNNGNALRYDY